MLRLFSILVLPSLLFSTEGITLFTVSFILSTTLWAISSALFLTSVEILSVLLAISSIVSLTSFFISEILSVEESTFSSTSISLVSFLSWVDFFSTFNLSSTSVFLLSSTTLLVVTRVVGEVKLTFGISGIEGMEILISEVTSFSILDSIVVLSSLAILFFNSTLCSVSIFLVSSKLFVGTGTIGKTDFTSS